MPYSCFVDELVRPVIFHGGDPAATSINRQPQLHLCYLQADALHKDFILSKLTALTCCI